MKTTHKILGSTVIGAALLFSSAAHGQSAAATEPVCETHLSNVVIKRFRLSNLTAKIERGAPIKIIALGSSSTAGARASSPDRSFPARLQFYLADLNVKVVNLGRNGAEAVGMLDTFVMDKDTQDGDLLLLQAGVNTLLKSKEIVDARFASKDVQYTLDKMNDIINVAKQRNMKVILIDAQATPKVEEQPRLMEMLAGMSNLAQNTKSMLFSRYTLTKAWKYKTKVNGNDHDGAIDPSTVMSYTDPDGLHLNDHGYDCWAKSMAGIIRMQAVNPMVSTLSKP